MRRKKEKKKKMGSYKCGENKRNNSKKHRN